MRTLRLVLGTATLLWVAGCTLNTDYFSEYRGKNILGNYDFNAVSGTVPKWTTTTLGQIASAPTTDYYMTWGQATDLASTGDGKVTRLDRGPDGTPAYRLEIKNLIPDGDFEALADAALANALVPGMAAGWSLTATTRLRSALSHVDNGVPYNASQPIPAGGLRTLNNRSILFAAQNGADYLKLQLDLALGSTLWLPGQYRLRLDLIDVSNGSSATINLLDGGGASLTPTVAEDSGNWSQAGLSNLSKLPLTVASLSKTFTVNAGDQRVLQFGNSSQPDAVLLDNVRLLLANGDFSATASFASLSSGSLPLLPGTKPGAYTFTIRVHDDPTADQTGASGTPAIAHVGNRFYSGGLTVTIRGKAKNSPGTKVLFQQFVPRPTAGWTTWTTLSFQGGLDFVDTDADLAGSPALIVSLSPSDSYDLSTGGKDVGSLLVAEPILTFNP